MYHPWSLPVSGIQISTLAQPLLLCQTPTPTSHIQGVQSSLNSFVFIYNKNWRPIVKTHEMFYPLLCLSMFRNTQFLDHHHKKSWKRMFIGLFFCEYIEWYLTKIQYSIFQYLKLFKTKVFLQITNNGPNVLLRKSYVNEIFLGTATIFQTPITFCIIRFQVCWEYTTHGTSRSPGRLSVSSQRGNKEKYSLSSGRNTRSYQGEILFVIKGKSHKKAAKLPN